MIITITIQPYFESWTYYHYNEFLQTFQSICIPRFHYHTADMFLHFYSMLLHWDCTYLIRTRLLLYKNIFIKVSVITYLFHIGYPRRVYYNCMLYCHHSLQHTFHHFYKHLHCLESICLLETEVQYLNNIYT